MPRVPTAPGPQVSSTPLEGGFQRAPNSDAPFGGAAGRQMQNLANAGFAAGEQIDRVFQQRAVEKAFELENAVSSEYVKKRDEILKTRRLGDAAGTAAEIETWWSTEAPKMYGNADPLVKRALEKSLSRHKLQALGEFTTYERDQLDKVGQINYETLQQNEGRATVGFLVAGNEAEAAVGLKKMQDAARAYLLSKDVPPDAINEEIRARTGKVNLEVVSGLLQADPKRAKEFYNRAGVKDTLTREQQAATESRIKLLVDAQDGAQEALKLVQTDMAGKKHYDAFDYAGMEAKLVEKYKDNPDALKAARSELDRAGAIWQRQQAEIQAAGTEGVYEQLRAGTPLRKIMGSPAWEQMSPSRRDQFLEQQQNRWEANQSRAEASVARAERAEERRTAEIALELTDPDRLAKLTKEEITALRPALGEKNYGKVVKAWQDYQGNQVKLSNAKFDNDMLNETMIAFGFDPKPRPKDKDGAATVMRARNAIDDEIARAQLRVQRELTSQEKRDVAIEVLSRKVKEKTLFGYREVPDITTSELSEDAFVELPTAPATNGRRAVAAPRVYLKDIPTAEAADIKRYLQDTNQPDSDAAVLRFYASQLQLKKTTK